MDYSPFTEKYRPKTLDNVIGHTEIVKSLKLFVKTKNMPNLLFAGGPGIGKTTCALALAHDLFGDDFSSSFLELNASDERGIDVIRGKVKDFARINALSTVPFKIIFLDEADALTQDAQHALRRTMEMYCNVTRFILSCNYSSKIIEPIQSRCSLFRFRQVPEQDIKLMIDRVCREEGITIDEEGKKALCSVSEGDMRRLLNVLQACSMHSKKIDKDLVERISGTVSLSGMSRVVDAIIKSDFNTATGLVSEYLVEYGLSAEDLISQLYKHVLATNMPEKMKMEFIDSIGEFHFRITEGSNEHIQLRAMIARLCLIAQKK